ncbi:hypothetical protein [Pantoea ananatis]|uniref:hypothetical protein n=1 Tax=Pantoea ananas TaxID=553 RepID=UPI0011409F25|nr:hypothetical protein [Pantoea ananatis]QZE28681.1 hypothetical protein K4732_17520 [Pantoea ananatis]
MTSKWGRLEAHQGLNEKKFSTKEQASEKVGRNTLKRPRQNPPLALSRAFFDQYGKGDKTAITAMLPGFWRRRE